jgi:hypothetical protein
MPSELAPHTAAGLRGFWRALPCNMHRLLSFSLSIASSAFALFACEDDRECTAAGCVDRAYVSILGPAAAWADGAYSLDIGLAQQHRCDFVLPVPGGVNVQAPIEGVPISCTPALEGGFDSRAVVLFPEVSRQADGSCSMTADAGLGCDVTTYRIDIDTDGSAERVEVRLAVGSTVLLEQTNTFDYQTVQPNGPECGPTCRNANVRMSIPAP